MNQDGPESDIVLSSSSSFAQKFKKLFHFQLFFHMMMATKIIELVKVKSYRQKYNSGLDNLEMLKMSQT